MGGERAGVTPRLGRPGGRCGKHWGTKGRGEHVEPSLDRRRGRGRRRSDVEEPLAVRGLLHDLGHQMTTLSYLVEAVRGDVDLPGDAGSRLELLSLEMSRLLDIIAEEIPARSGVSAVAEVELRSLAGQVIKLAWIAHEGSVILEPGPEVTVEASPALLWRVLTNVVDNAARAVGLASVFGAELTLVPAPTSATARAQYTMVDTWGVEPATGSSVAADFQSRISSA